MQFDQLKRREFLKSSGIIWNDDTLDEWIKDPQHFIPGNTMTFAGMNDRRQRADLLTFLKDASQPGHAPKAAQGDHQMDGMMGGSAVPNLRKLDPVLANFYVAMAGPRDVANDEQTR